MLQKYGENCMNDIHSNKDIKIIITDKTRLTYYIIIHTAENIDYQEFSSKVLPSYSSLEDSWSSYKP